MRDSLKEREFVRESDSERARVRETERVRERVRKYPTQAPDAHILLCSCGKVRERMSP